MAGSKRVLVRISSFLLCIAAFLFLCMIFMISSIRIGLTEKHIADVINNADLNELYLRETGTIRIASGAYRMVFSSAKPAAGSSLADMIYDLIDEKTRNEYNITKESIARVLKHPKIKEFLANKTAGYLTDLINGRTDASIARSEVIELLEENPDILKEALGKEPTEADYEKVISYIPETVTLSNIIDGMAGSLSGSSANGAANTDLDVNRLLGMISVVQAVLSVRSIVLLTILLTTVIFALILINKSNKRISLVYLGISLTAAGAVYLVLWLLIEPIIAAVSSGINIQANLLILLMARLKIAFLCFGVSAVCIGAAMTAGYSVLKQLDIHPSAEAQPV